VSDLRFSGQVVLITGGSSGIGLAAAQLFVAEGAQVVLVGRDPGALQAAAAKLGGEVLTVAADVGQVADVERVVADVKQRHGHLDVLFANAGMSECPPIQGTDDAFFERIMGVNVKGVFFMFVRALPLFRPGGSAIFTATATHARGKPGDPSPRPSCSWRRRTPPTSPAPSWPSTAAWLRSDAQKCRSTVRRRSCEPVVVPRTRSASGVR
jgi:NAD(P)-dependent dehydrogenase (short-subunit alcohol dehydrogenase family)